MRKKLVSSSVILAASLFASSAHAAQFVEITGPSGVFGDGEVVCTGGGGPCNFTRTFNFFTPAGFSIVSADISSIATSNPLTNIDFSSVTLNGVNFNVLATGTQEFRNLLNQSMLAGANNTLIVNGTTGGNAAFSGNLSFGTAAVPEPATWMMMLLGMGGIGFAMRRRNKATLRVRYT